MHQKSRSTASSQACWLIALGGSYAGDANTYLVWYETAQGENCILTVDGALRRFCQKRVAEIACEALGLAVQETVCYDVERLEYWVSTGSLSQIRIPGTEEIDCAFLLDFWNLFTDIGAAVREPLEPVLTRRMCRCYDKLFRGCNLPAVSPEGVQFSPVFTRRELRDMRRVMCRGLEMYRQH